MAARRINDHPMRYIGGLNYQLCAALHNRIIALGWIKRGFTLNSLDKRSWWNYYGGNAVLASLSIRLHASIVLFLKAAWHGFEMKPGYIGHLFHGYLACLCSPDELWENQNYAEDESNSESRRFITLYRANRAPGDTDPLGLVLCQANGTAMYHMSVNDRYITMNGRQKWLPLEWILQGFIEMMQQGKFEAINENYSGEQERTGPWIMPSYTEFDLLEALMAFKQLVDAIHRRMPSQPQNTGHGLLDLVSRGSSENLPRSSFANRFLAQCVRPAFTYVAPGLSVAQYQPFAPAPGQMEAGKLYPMLLFSGKSLAHREILLGPWDQEVSTSPFASNFDHISSYPAGLYLTETNPHGPHPFEDGVKLVLPFTLGSNKFARTSDGALIGEDVRQPGVHSEAVRDLRSTALYQQGFNPFIAAHDAQLNRVLWRWSEMVESGKWRVDKDGVAVTVEEWKQADTRENWQDYQLPMHW